MSTPLPPWLDTILAEAENPEAVWRDLHALWTKRHPSKKTGPRKLTMADVCLPVEGVLERMTPAIRSQIEWGEFIILVQQAVGNSPNKEKGVTPRLYHETVLRPLVMDYICAALQWREIPPKLFARRKPWMPADRFDLAARRLAFYQNQARLLGPGLRETALSLLPPDLQAQLLAELRPQDLANEQAFLNSLSEKLI